MILKDIKPLIYGVLLLSAAGLVLNACRTSKPPVIALICLGDGLGGADCSASTGEHVYLKPTDLKNWWMISQTDAANLLSWCYMTTPHVAQAGMQDMFNKIHDQ